MNFTSKMPHPKCSDREVTVVECRKLKFSVLQMQPGSLPRKLQKWKISLLVSLSSQVALKPVKTLLLRHYKFMK